MKMDNKRIWSPLGSIDIFDNILPYLDTKSIQNFLLISKTHYTTLYKQQELYINKKITVNILKELNLSLDYRKEFSRDLCSIYKHFYNHLNSCIIDYVIFLIERDTCGGCKLISSLLQLCKFKNDSRTKTRYEISRNDMQYILMHAKVDILHIILDTYYIPPDLLFNVLQETTMTKNGNNTNLLLKYFMYKHIFRTATQEVVMFFNLIIGFLVKQKMISIIQMVIKYKNKYKIDNVLDYNYLYNICISEDNLSSLILIHTEFINNSLHPPIIINHSSVKSMLQKRQSNGDCLQFVLDNLLGTHINHSLYINAISSTDITQTTMNILKTYLNDETKKKFKIKD
jgi:hypothetical protein